MFGGAINVEGPGDTGTTTGGGGAHTHTLNGDTETRPNAVGLVLAIWADTPANAGGGGGGGTGIPGPAGPAGPAGADGTAGTDGTNGTDGAVGAAGAAGTNGIDGANGTDGIAGVNCFDGLTDQNGDTVIDILDCQGSTAVADDVLDFDKFVDAMTIDAATSINTTNGLEMARSDGSPAV